MKIGKYIFEILPLGSYDHYLSLPYNNIIWWSPKEYIGNTTWKDLGSKRSKHIKPNTGIRYKIIGFYCGVLIIKQLN